MLKAVIFDLDGTLTDSDLYLAKKRVSEEIAAITAVPYEKVWEKMEKIHYTCNLEGVYERNDWWEQFNLGLSQNEKQQLTTLYWNTIVETTTVKPCAEQLLKTLKGKVILVLLTDYDGESFSKRERISSLSIVPYFDLVVIAGEDTVECKPSLQPFVYILKALNMQPDETLMVGDKPEVDLAGADALGMKTLLLHGDYGTQWEHSVKDLTSVLQYIEELLSTQEDGFQSHTPQ